MIRKNMGRLDRALRLITGVALIPVGLFALGGSHGDAAGLAVAAFALMPLATSAVGFCPGYVPLGVSTLRREPTSAPDQVPAEGGKVPVQ